MSRSLAGRLDRLRHHPQRGLVVDLWNSEGHASDTSESDETTAQHDEAEKPLSIMFERYVNAKRRCRLLFQALGALTAIEVDDTDAQTTPAFL